MWATCPALLKCNVCPSVRRPDADEISHQDVGGVMDRTADVGGQEEGDRLGGHKWGHWGAGGPGIIPPVATGPGKTGQTGGRTSHPYCPAHTAQFRLNNDNRLPLQPRKASATCSSATAAASSGLEDWSARSPRQRDSDPSHSDLSNTPSSNNKPPSPAGAALILSKPPSPCAPGTHHHRLQLPPSERRLSLFTSLRGNLWTETASGLTGGWLVSALMDLCLCRSQQSESSSSGIQSHHAGDVSYGLWWVHLCHPTAKTALNAVVFMERMTSDGVTGTSLKLMLRT